MARKNAVVSVESNNAGLIFTVAGVGEFSIALSDIPKEVLHQATLHGLTQKISDAAALGKDATPADKFAAMQAVADRLTGEDASWNKRSGEGSGAPSGVIFTALYEFTVERMKKAKKPVPSEEAVREYYNGKSRAEQLAFRKVPEIAAIIERIKSERGAAKSVDTDALLSDLDNIG